MAVRDGKENKTGIDDKLIYKIANGDDEAFSELYYSTYRQLYAFVISMTGNSNDVDDIIQETYIKVKGAAHLYKPEGKALSWIFKIAQNEARMIWRKTKNVTFQELSDAGEEIAFDNVKNVEDRELLRHAFTVLSKEEIQIVTLYLVSGFKHREIAEILGIPLATVLSKYRRGLKKMEKRLRQEYDYE